MPCERINSVKDKVFSNKKLLFFVVLITILSYGFTVSNFSYGIDDPADIHYFHTNNYGNMIQQGRLGQLFLDRIFGVGRLVPFFNDFVGAFLLMSSALVFILLFQYVTDGKLSDTAAVVFAGVYISYPIINEKFIYNLDVIATTLSYLCVPSALIFVCIFIDSRFKKKSAFIYSVLLTCIAVSSYETFIFLFIQGFFALQIVRILWNGEKIRFGQMVKEGLIFAAVLLVSMLLYYLAVFVCQMTTGQLGKFSRSGTIMAAFGSKEWSQVFVTNLKSAMTNFAYLSIKIFIVISVLGFALTVFWTIKKKSFVLLFSGVFLYIANFILPAVMAQVLYRTCQTFCFTVAFIMLTAVYTFQNKKALRIAVSVVSAYLILIQCVDLNLWFYKDYTRYKKEEFAINSIASRLTAECDCSKPIVFVSGDSDLSIFETSNWPSQVNGSSMMRWGVGVFGDDTSPVMLRLFELHGYPFFVSPNQEQCDLAKQLCDGMEPWPAKTSIKEFDEIIIIML